MSAPTFDPALQNLTIRTAEGALYHAPTLADAMEGLGRHLQDGDGRAAVIFAGHPSDGAKVVLRVDLDGLPDAAPTAARPPRTLRSALDSWHSAPDYRAAYDEMNSLAQDLGGGISFYVRGANGLSIDVQLLQEARGVPAGPVAKIYLNDASQRGASLARVDLAEAIGRAVASFIQEAPPLGC